MSDSTTPSDTQAESPTELLTEWDHALDTAGLYDHQRRSRAEGHLFGAMVTIIATGDQSVPRAPLVDQLREAMTAATKAARS